MFHGRLAGYISLNSIFQRTAPVAHSRQRDLDYADLPERSFYKTSLCFSLRPHVRGLCIIFFVQSLYSEDVVTLAFFRDAPMQTPKQTAMEIGAGMKIQELVGLLGFNEAIHGTKNVLLNDIYEFLNAYLARGFSIPYSTRRSEQAIQCAVEFLEEGSRGEKYWPAPPTSSGNLVWSTDRDW